MNKFVPHEPDKMVVVEITTSEAMVIQELREYQFVKLTVHKSGGVLVRTEINESKLIDGNGQVTLPIVQR